MTSVTEQRRTLTTDEAIARLKVTPDYDPGGGATDCVHTFRVGSGMALGAHWTLEKTRETFDKFGVKEAPQGVMGHALLVVDDSGPVLFETVEREVA